jgi:hypothetical protein
MTANRRRAVRIGARTLEHLQQHSGEKADTLLRAQLGSKSLSGVAPLNLRTRLPRFCRILRLVEATCVRRTQHAAAMEARAVRGHVPRRPTRRGQAHSIAVDVDGP